MRATIYVALICDPPIEYASERSLQCSPILLRAAGAVLVLILFGCTDDPQPNEPADMLNKRVVDQNPKVDADRTPDTGTGGPSQSNTGGTTNKPVQ